MTAERVQFLSGGLRIEADLYVPEDIAGGGTSGGNGRRLVLRKGTCAARLCRGACSEGYLRLGF